MYALFPLARVSGAVFPWVPARAGRALLDAPPSRLYPQPFSSLGYLISGIMLCESLALEGTAWTANGRCLDVYSAAAGPPSGDTRFEDRADVEPFVASFTDLAAAAAAGVPALGPFSVSLPAAALHEYNWGIISWHPWAFGVATGAAAGAPRVWFNTANGGTYFRFLRPLPAPGVGAALLVDLAYAPDMVVVGPRGPDGAPGAPRLTLLPLPHSTTGVVARTRLVLGGGVTGNASAPGAARLDLYYVHELGAPPALYAADFVCRDSLQVVYAEAAAADGRLTLRDWRHVAVVSDLAPDGAGGVALLNGTRVDVVAV